MKNILFLAFLIVLFSTNINCEKQQNNDDELGEFNFIMNIFEKYDPQKTLHFDKPTYAKVLSEVLLTGIVESGDQATERERKLVSEAIELYVEEQKQKNSEKDSDKFITYREVVADLQGRLFDFFKNNLNDPKYHEVYEILFDSDSKTAEDGAQIKSEDL